MAHNHEVAGSSPAPATKKRIPACLGFFSWSMVVLLKLRPNRSQVRNASGISQGSPLLKLCFKDVATGSRNVTESCPRYQDKSPILAGVLFLVKVLGFLLGDGVDGIAE